MVNTLAGAGINGGIGRSRTGEPWAAFYVEADDPGAVLERAEFLGAAIVVPVTELPGFTFAMFDDPDGLLIGLMKPVAAPGMGPPTEPVPRSIGSRSWARMPLGRRRSTASSSDGESLGMRRPATAWSTPGRATASPGASARRRRV